MDPLEVPRSPLTRRALLGGAGSAALVSLLSACAGSAGGSGGSIKFWDLPWGTQAYTAAAKKLALGVSLGKGLTPTYQVVQWNNFLQTFASALSTGNGPAVSTGGPALSVQFAAKGWVENVDDVIAEWKKSGLYDDFLPGSFDPYKTANGYQAIPFQQDIRVLWYRKSLLEKAGADVPTDWPSWLAAGRALKKIGAYAFGTGGGSGNNLGQQAMLSMMLNNGGGLFDEGGAADCVTARNVEAMDFVREMVAGGMVDPAAVSYTSDNLNTQWKDGHIGLGIHTPGLDAALGEKASGDFVVAAPLKGPHGTTGAMSYVNNLILYKKSPSLQASTTMLTHFVKNMHVLWERGLLGGLPLLKSVADSAAIRTTSPQYGTVIDKWQPVAKTLRERATADSPQIEAVDASAPLLAFAQTMIQGTTDSKTALQTLETGLRSVMK